MLALLLGSLLHRCALCVLVVRDMDPRKQLTIRTGSVRRLGGDYRSYASEYAAYCRQLEAAIQSGDAHAIRKAREFVDECHATRVDIGLRLAEARSALEQHMQRNTQLTASAEWAKAQQTLQDNRPQQEELQVEPMQRSSQQQQQPSTFAASSSPLPSSQRDAAMGDSEGSSVHVSAAAPFSLLVPSPSPSRFSVAVYGGSQAKPGEPAYERAKQLGSLLAQQQFHIVSAQHSHERRQNGTLVEGRMECGGMY